MAAKKKKKAGKAKKKKKTGDLIISKSRTKGAVDCKVSSDFYGALDEVVRDMLVKAEDRCGANNRATLRPRDL